jgi:hypothetical protein
MIASLKVDGLEKEFPQFREGSIGECGGVCCQACLKKTTLQYEYAQKNPKHGCAGSG